MMWLCRWGRSGVLLLYLSSLLCCCVYLCCGVAAECHDTEGGCHQQGCHPEPHRVGYQVEPESKAGRHRQAGRGRHQGDGLSVACCVRGQRLIDGQLPADSCCAGQKGAHQ